MKIEGSSFKKDFVHCIQCEKEYVWLKSYPTVIAKGCYYALCAKCKKKPEYRVKMLNPKKVKT